MATFAPHPQESNLREQPVPPVEPSGESAPVEAGVNGVSSHQNGVAPQPLDTAVAQPSSIPHKPIELPPLSEILPPESQISNHMAEQEKVEVRDGKPSEQPVEQPATLVEPPKQPLSDVTGEQPVEHVEQHDQVPAQQPIDESVSEPILSPAPAIPAQTPADAVSAPAETAETLPATDSTSMVLEENPISPKTVDAPVLATVTSPTVPENIVTPTPPQETPQFQAPTADIPQSDSTELETKMDIDVVPAVKLSREREEDDDPEPAAKRTKVDEISATTPAAPLTTITTNGDIPASVPIPAISTPSNAIPSAVAAVPATPAPPPPEITGDFGPMTEPVLKRLLEGMRNLKKSKSSPAFLRPVDWQTLNLPTYPNIVKVPMDLGTMEQKLKSHAYTTVNEYVDDFNLMVRNAIAFNTSQHPVAQAAMSLQSAVQAQLRKLPGPGEPAPKPRQPSISQPPVEKKRRESRPSLGAAQSPTNTFAAPNGVPTIRRDSTVGNRPKREIHRPPPRDLPYAGAKPRKKKFQAELQFCGEVLAELKRPRYQQYLVYFIDPVDPVALNIPTYRKIVKNPMDISTITSKYENNQYQNSKEFEKDWHLMFSNCYKFNGLDHPVTKVAKEYETIFNDEMAKKDSWIATHAPPSEAQSPAAESGSEVEDEEESEDEEEAARNAQLAQMHAQIAALQAQTASLMAAGVKKDKKPTKKKEKTSKTPKAGKKSGPSGSGKDKKPKSGKAAKQRPITTRDKEEIVAKIGELDAAGMGRAAELIKASFRRAGRHDLADKPDDDLEFDIDVIPDDGLQGLLKLVREVVPSAVPSKENVPAPQAYGAAKQKKNRPMNRREQEEAVNRLEQQIAGFDSGGIGDMSDNESSGDEDDDDEESGSESEEE